MLGTAAIMAGVAALLVVVGVAFLGEGGEDAVVFGWVTLGWGVGGLGSALVLAIRAWWR